MLQSLCSIFVVLEFPEDGFGVFGECGFFLFVIARPLDHGIGALLDQDIKLHMGEILRNVGRFPNFLTYPLPAQIAIFDRVFNRGLTSIISTTSFLDAIRSRNWKAAVQAANHSDVADANPDRQATVKDLFLNAAVQEPFFIDPKCPPKPILHVRDAMFL